MESNVTKINVVREDGKERNFECVDGRDPWLVLVASSHGTEVVSFTSEADLFGIVLLLASKIKNKDALREMAGYFAGMALGPTLPPDSAEAH